MDHSDTFKKIFGSTILLVIGGGGISLAQAAPAEHQTVTGPVAEYWVSTTTSTGISAAGLAGGGRPSLGSMMNMMRGGVTHTMHLQLGSSLNASGDPSADHLPPVALDGGKDLPLFYKVPVSEKTVPSDNQGEPSQPSEPPKGKILIFWGCGEHAPKNQPTVIDLSKLADPAARMALIAKMSPVQPVPLDTVRPPSPDRWKTYGEWPNQKSRVGLDGNSSLLGAHLVKGNYSPDINFTLAPNQDFMAPITIISNSRDGDGAVPLQWHAVPGARGIIASAMGGGKDSDGSSLVVVWTSAQSQMGWTGLAADYLTPHDEDRLITAKLLLPGDATSCTVPAEVLNATGAQGALFYSMTAYGGEANFAYPARPQDAKTPWNIQWETKVRYKTTTGGMLGRTMTGDGGFMGAQSNEASEAGASVSTAAGDPSKKKKGSLFGDMVKQGLSAMVPGSH